MRKRDDVFERLYSAFILFRDSDNNVVPTNTLDVIIKSGDVDFSMSQTHRHIVKAGKIYKYIADNTDPYVAIQKDLTYKSDLDVFEDSTNFIYMNPLLMVIGSNPLSVGFYLNSVSESIPINSVNRATDSFYQFIIDSIQIERNAMVGEDEYTFEVKLSPTALLPEEAFVLVQDDTAIESDTRVFVNPTDGYRYIDNQNLKVFVEILGKSNERKFFVALHLYRFDDDYYYMLGTMKTNDYIAADGSIQIIDGFLDGQTMSPHVINPILIPGDNCSLRVYSLYKYPDDSITKISEFNAYPGLEKFSLTNEYQTKETKAKFVTPISQIQSYVQYSVRDTDGSYGFRLDSVPLIKANYMKIQGTRESFIKDFTEMYSYIDAAMDRLTNNFSVDMKFFNTYGASKHYYLTEATPELIKNKDGKASTGSSGTISPLGSCGCCCCEDCPIKETCKHYQAAMKKKEERKKYAATIDNTYDNTLTTERPNATGIHIDRVNIKLHFTAKFTLISNKEAEVTNVTNYIKSLVESTDLSLVSSPSFYMSTIVTQCMNKFSTIQYMTYVGLNEYDSNIQALESDVNEYNIINGVIQTSSVIPEYLNIDFKITQGVRSPQIIIDTV